MTVFRRTTLPRSQCFGDSSVAVNDMDFQENRDREMVVVVVESREKERRDRRIVKWCCLTFLADNGRCSRTVIVSNAAAVRKRPMFSLRGRSIQRTILSTASPDRVAAVWSGRGIASNVNTVDASEIELFSRLSSQWWDERGEFAMLHKMNPVRMEFIKQKLQEVQLEEGTSPFVQCDPVGGTRYPRRWMWRRVVVRGAVVSYPVFLK
jgi:hypothetical protein